jgi:hypothetical protein
MNKKDYLNLVQEYESTIEEKRFNLNYYSEIRLEELKKIINRELSYHQGKCLANNVQEVRHLYAPIMQKIKNGESIQSFNYEKCYIDSSIIYVGPFKLKQILILQLIGGLAFIARWCLSYLGLI